MGDLAKCRGQGCSIRNICYRFRSISERGYYANFDRDPQKCWYYVPVRKDDKLAPIEKGKK
jgi:hypothetical protein